MKIIDLLSSILRWRPRKKKFYAAAYSDLTTAIHASKVFGQIFVDDEGRVFQLEHNEHGDEVMIDISNKIAFAVFKPSDAPAGSFINLN